MRLLRIIYNLAILAIFILGIIKLIQKEYYLAFIWIILVPILMLFPRNLYKISWINQKYNKKLIYLFEMFILILLFTGAGFTLGLKYLPIDFDSYSHLINLTIFSIIFGVIYYIIKNRITKKEISRKEIALFALVFSILFGVILWEKFQMLNDNLFGTQMFFDYFQSPEYDSMLDQIYGVIGAIIGSILIYFKFDDWINKWRR